jgi:hypothetical protein
MKLQPHNMINNGKYDRKGRIPRFWRSTTAGESPVVGRRWQNGLISSASTRRGYRDPIRPTFTEEETAIYCPDPHCF